MRDGDQKNKKKKLRTAGDVLNRLRWEEPNNNHDTDTNVVGDTTTNDILVGYMDRIEGPMEKSVQDFKSAKTEGGDIPEHRILYFRRRASSPDENEKDEDDDDLCRLVLWDRAGRVDKIFGSGNGNGGASNSNNSDDDDEADAASQSIIISKETIDAVRRARATMIRIE